MEGNDKELLGILSYMKDGPRESGDIALKEGVATVKIAGLLRSLMRRGLVVSKEVKKPGRGTPIRMYSVTLLGRKALESGVIAKSAKKV